MPGESARVGLQGVSLTVHEGEIVGIAGVSGNGQSALAGLLAGTGRARGGHATIGGVPLGRARGPRCAAGIGRIPEDRAPRGRRRRAHASPRTSSSRRSTCRTSSAWASCAAAPIRARARAAIAAYDVRCPGPDAPIRLLSGGNIQKVILARVLDREPRLILANQPTRGLDVGAAADVHRRLLEARARGAGIVLISEDLDELLALSDRIARHDGGRLQPA